MPDPGRLGLRLARHRFHCHYPKAPGCLSCPHPVLRALLRPALREPHRSVPLHPVSLELPRLYSLRPASPALLRWEPRRPVFPVPRPEPDHRPAPAFQPSRPGPPSPYCRLPLSPAQLRSRSLLPQTSVCYLPLSLYNRSFPLSPMPQHNPSPTISHTS